MPKRAYSYLRCSRRKQAKGDSIRRQSVFGEAEELDRGGMAALAAEICAEEDAILDDSLQFEDIGVSARRGRNAIVGRLGEFLQLVECGRIAPGSIFILENLDRLSREKLPRAMKLFMGLLEAGIVIWTARPRRRYTLESVSDLPGILEPLIHMVRAFEESERKSVLLKQMWGKKKQAARSQKAGLGNRSPGWVEWDADLGKYVERHPHWATVQQMCRMALDGLGCTRIAQSLAAEPAKYPPMGRTAWSEQYVRRTLKSRTLLGEYQPGRVDDQGRQVAEGEPILGYYPSVIEEAEWWRVQAAIASRKRRSGRPGHEEANLFTGLAYEARSRHRLRMRSAPNPRPGKLHYLYLDPADKPARSKPKGSKTTVLDRVPYRPFEACVLRMLKDLRAEDLRPADKAERQRLDRIVKLTANLTAYDEKRKSFQEKLADPDISPDRAAALEGVLYQVAERRAADDRECRRLKLEGQSGREETLGELQSLALMLETAQGDERVKLRQRLKGRLSTFVESIWTVVQAETQSKKVLHVQIFLRDGSKLYGRTIPPANKWGTIPVIAKKWNLRDVDLRTWQDGDVLRVTSDAEGEPQLVG
jgi:DNA invertase Pin-like site-specific DNA recombinase